MSLGSIIYKILIGPLELFFEVVFVIADRHLSNPAYSIIFLSLAMNFLVLPLYRRADKVQAEERDRENALAPWVRHIKKTFKGDERFMMLQTLYRENDYKPTDSLKGSVSLLLEIPFFIAAYHYLSNLKTIRGVPFGPIADLGAPDALLTIGVFTLNLLPILMTLINMISAAIYLKGFPLKNKIQMYGIAVIFLVLLYNSPAGLVFYWTLNNLFSLAKNAFYKLPNPGKVFMILCSASSAVMFIVFVSHPFGNRRTQLIVILALLALQLPLILHGRTLPVQLPDASVTTSIFYGSSIAITILTGILIPAAVINDSVLEFIDPDYFVSPLWYIVSSAALATGTFLIWFGIFYRLASDRGKQIISVGMIAALCCALTDYMLFGKGYGNFSSSLIYDTTPQVSVMDIMLNLIVLTAICTTVIYIIIKKTDVMKRMTIVIMVSLLIMSGINVYGIASANPESAELLTKTAGNENSPVIKLSKKGKNVVVIMMDRMIGHYVPYILHEKPELKTSFEGFTFYSNSFSYGNCTNAGSPGLYGGYEYIPSEMNRKAKMRLEDKHNEALKVMPKIFSDAGFDVSVINPTYAGYKWIPDLALFDDIDNVSSSITNGKFSLEEYSYSPKDDKQQTASRMRNFFCYSIFKSSPTLLHPSLYAGGTYNGVKSEQRIIDINRSIGYKRSFMDSYSALCNMIEMTELSDSGRGAFTMISNDTTHEPMMLQEPSYIPAEKVDNKTYSKVKSDGEGNKLVLEDETQQIHYQTNMAAMIKIAEWLNYLKANELYDNTRIIIVSDHGRDLHDTECPIFEYTNDKGDSSELDTAFFNCALMIKDYNSHEYSTNENLTSNADVPYRAVEGVIQDAQNPYTGKKLELFKDQTGKPELMYTNDWSIDKNNGNKFLPAAWFTVRDNLFAESNWKYIGIH